MILQAIRELQHGHKKLEGVCGRIVEQQSKVMSAVSEMKELLQEQTKKNFTLKGSSYVTRWGETTLRPYNRIFSSGRNTRKVDYGRFLDYVAYSIYINRGTCQQSFKQ